MSDDLKKMYKTVMDDHFPPEITISFGGRPFSTGKGLRIQDEDSGELIEKVGLRMVKTLARGGHV
jgi:phosphoribosylaminoimidazolecarboxamide formyltransferase/IMP cyclohydrolase